MTKLDTFILIAIYTVGIGIALTSDGFIRGRVVGVLVAVPLFALAVFVFFTVKFNREEKLSLRKAFSKAWSKMIKEDTSKGL